MADHSQVVRIWISRSIHERTKNFVAALQPLYPWLTFEGIVNLALENMVVSYEVLNAGSPFPTRDGELRLGRPPAREEPSREFSGPGEPEETP